MQKLNLPAIRPLVRKNPAGKKEIFDPCRKRYVRLTPEEWVRQNFLQFMMSHLGFPSTLIVVEASLKVNRMPRRFDILACRSDGKPGMVIECKAPGVEITQATFDQVARYNLELEVDFLAVTNGLTHYACHLDHRAKSYRFLEAMPDFPMVNQTGG
ncbi:MAG TPA: type I restriction enzyme HsdR N-terminal domain-containing protein [Bacteroidales bacterium]|nr:type I restriction enzyme HsdR N-terminal domain-containing protein [Bacteroidales bacterium]HPS61561.1 type I restriction enzyme HsdR N-terminal domain-containing protein [Bacteroidales bacterium]